MVYCEATIEEDMLRDNLVQCTKILGGEPQVHGYTVSVSMDNNEQSAKMVHLYEQFSSHNLYIEITP